MLQVQNDTAIGDFLLSDSLPTSNYQIRAYTNWMRNFDEDYFYSSALKVYNFNTSNPSWTVNARITNYPKSDSLQLYFEDQNFNSDSKSYYDFAVKDDSDNVLQKGRIYMKQKDYFILKCGLNQGIKVSKIYVTLSNELYEKQIAVQVGHRPILQFFPEGGEMVSDLVNAVAFELTDQAGNPIKPIGELIDQDSAKIIPLNELHEGRGLLIFRPEKGKKYHAKIRHENQWYFYPLPDAMDKGVVLSAINSYDEDLTLKIVTNDLSGRYAGPFMLVGQVRGKVYWSKKIELSRGSVRLKVPKAAFPSGILQLTLFGVNNSPILERLVFINHHELVKINIVTEKETYLPREKVEIFLNVRGLNEEPIAAKMSATVLDSTQLPIANSENIVSYLLLSSDVIGPINDPLQYFRSSDRQTQLALDLLMMTRGWRRFKWEDVLKNKGPDISYVPEQGFRITGTVSQTWNEKPVEDRIVKLAFIGSEASFMSTKTDANGKFGFSDMSFNDSTVLIFKTEGKRGKRQSYNLTLLPRELPEIVTTQGKHVVSSTVIDYITQSKIRKNIELAYIRDTSTILLEEVEVKGYKIDPDNDRIKMHGEADYTLHPTSEDVKTYVYTTDLLRTQVPGLQISGFGADAEITSLGKMMYPINSNNIAPLLLLDGVPLSPASLINTIPLDMIESIEVIKNTVPVVYGAGGIYGVVAIYTKKGSSFAPGGQGISNLKYLGYSVPREYYSINYDLPQDEHIMPDQRANLMWAPDLQTDLSGNVSFTFFNSDLKTKVVVFVEGITEDGIPFAGDTSYEIK
jgi:hypothetical protein